MNRAVIEAAREAEVALRKADAALDVLTPTCISQFKNKLAAQTLITSALTRLTAALAEHGREG